MQGMIVLGIETSCDETSAAVLRQGRVASNQISSQLVHREFGGVVPELASRAHQRLIIPVVEAALREAGVSPRELDGIAATQGPGLVGALLVGLNFAKALAYALEKPFVGVNHMEGHLYSPFLAEEPPSYPFLSLIVSGGHTMLTHVRAPGDHHVLGETRDDAAGEAFDKVAKMLGLGYPGGPEIDRLAADGNPEAIRFPRGLLQEPTLDFSFSGVKTAVLYYLRGRTWGENRDAPEQRAALADVCASFQAAVVDVLVEKTMRAAHTLEIECVTLAGGVAANSSLRRCLDQHCRAEGRRLIRPPLQYCMDNGAMIAFVGWMKMQRGVHSGLGLPAVANMRLT
jgi:N6-L-threonylcarbamoyladenine synthase